MKLSFYGAAQQVSGSMFLLELDSGYSILIDCGLDLSAQKENTTNFEFDPKKLDLVILTHAHVDHTGRLPLLLKAGYNGQILCTPPTLELTHLLLNDSIALNEKRLKRLQNRSYRYAHRAEEIELINLQQVEHTMDRFVTINFNRKFTINEDCSITFLPAGHLLGAASLLFEINSRDSIKKILFSGDLGRKNYPLLVDPVIPPQVDYLICETTYGNRSHQELGDPEKIIQQIIEDACVKTKGRLIIPSFSVGRSQSILYTLHKLYLSGKLPKIKIFTDSPMAELSSRIYEKYINLLNQEAQDIFNVQNSLFDFENLVYVSSYKESKAISNYYEPCIIISASGMITGGRMEMHVQKNLHNAYCTFLMIGYAADGTPGNKLLNGNKYIRIGKKDIPVEAKIKKTDIYSGHAGKEDLFTFVSHQNNSRLKNIFLVHGEHQSMIDFKESLRDLGFNKCEIPAKGATYSLD